MVGIEEPTHKAVSGDGARPQAIPERVSIVAAVPGARKVLEQLLDFSQRVRVTVAVAQASLLSKQRNEPVEFAAVGSELRDRDLPLEHAAEPRDGVNPDRRNLERPQSVFENDFQPVAADGYALPQGKRSGALNMSWQQ